jgi:hypothetical protein
LCGKISGEQISKLANVKIGGLAKHGPTKKVADWRLVDYEKITGCVELFR